MIIVVNGPLGIGKSTLAEVLSERIDQCVMLDGDHLVAANPPAADEVEHLHSTIELLIEHHQRFGYRHFVINHLWSQKSELDDLRARLAEAAPAMEVRVFLLTLPHAENLRRVERRQRARAVDDSAFELATVAEERAILYGDEGRERDELGELLDVSGSPDAAASTLMARLQLASQ